MKPKLVKSSDGVSQSAVNTVAEKPKGNPPVMRGVVQISTTIPLKDKKTGEPVMTKSGKPVFESEDVGEFAVWLPKQGEGADYNPFNPDYFGNIELLGRHGKIGLFEKKGGSNDPKYPVLTGEVYDAGRNIIGKVALWHGKSAHPKAPKYVGSLTVNETGFVYRLSVWAK